MASPQVGVILYILMTGEMPWSSMVSLEVGVGNGDDIFQRRSLDDFWKFNMVQRCSNNKDYKMHFHGWLGEAQQKGRVFWWGSVKGTYCSSW